MPYIEMWSFETKNIRITWEIRDSDYPDLSFDETGETSEKVSSGKWVCFDSKMSATHIGTGVELASDYLGESIYANPKEFRDHIGAQGRYGSYFRDMVSSVCADARVTLRSMQSLPVRGA